MRLLMLSTYWSRSLFLLTNKRAFICFTQHLCQMKQLGFQRMVAEVQGLKSQASNVPSYPSSAALREPPASRRKAVAGCSSARDRPGAPINSSQVSARGPTVQKQRRPAPPPSARRAENVQGRGLRLLVENDKRFKGKSDRCSNRSNANRRGGKYVHSDSLQEISIKHLCLQVWATCWSRSGQGTAQKRDLSEENATAARETEKGGRSKSPASEGSSKAGGRLLHGLPKAGLR